MGKGENFEFSPNEAAKKLQDWITLMSNQNNDCLDELQEDSKITKEEVNKEEYVDEIKISYASEYMIDISLIQKANEKSILCLKDKYILVEMSFVSLPNSLFELIFKLFFELVFEFKI